MEVICVHCATKFDRPPSQIRGGQIFCNKECRKAYHRPSIVCLGCGEKFQRVVSNSSKKYCTWECFKASRWAPVNCTTCGIIFQKRICEIAKAEVSGHKHMCSRSCRNVATSKLLGGDGEWVVGGKYGAARSRGKDWRYAKAYVLERDDYTCQQCDVRENLEVHHWEPYFISFDNSPDNLVTLCRSCHQAKHEEYRREGFYEDLYC
jgi:5-methylcytosine-specific restriction endonuclease McrA